MTRFLNFENLLPKVLSAKFVQRAEGEMHYFFNVLPENSFRNPMRRATDGAKVTLNDAVEQEDWEHAKNIVDATYLRKIFMDTELMTVIRNHRITSLSLYPVWGFTYFSNRPDRPRDEGSDTCNAVLDKVDIDLSNKIELLTPGTMRTLRLNPGWDTAAGSEHGDVTTLDHWRFINSEVMKQMWACWSSLEGRVQGLKHLPGAASFDVLAERRDAAVDDGRVPALEQTADGKTHHDRLFLKCSKEFYYEKFFPVADFAMAQISAEEIEETKSDVRIGGNLQGIAYTQRYFQNFDGDELGRMLCDKHAILAWKRHHGWKKLKTMWHAMIHWKQWTQ